jgi:hypothetical protein
VESVPEAVALMVGEAFRDSLAYADLGGVDRDAARTRREDDARERTDELIWQNFRERFGEALDALERYQLTTES